MGQKRPHGVVRPPLVRVRQETPPPPSVIASGERSIAIGGSMQGSISTGLVGTPKVVDRRSTEPACTHAGAVEVLRAIDNELVAWWCAECETQLPADFVGYRGLDKPIVGYTEQPPISLTDLFMPAEPTFVEQYADPELLQDRNWDHVGWHWTRVVTIVGLTVGMMALLIAQLIAR